MTARVSVGGVLSDTGRQYWGRTGVGGLSNAYSSGWRLQRHIWIVLFVIGLVFTVMDVVDVIKDYYSYPHTTQMEVVYDRSAHFPAVTVCSQSKIDCLRLVNASMNAPNDKRLNDVLDSFRCLDPDGLECPYVWDLADNAMTEEWFATHNAHCLRCHQCPHLERLMSHMRQKQQIRERAERLESLFVLIGCNTTCLPPPSKKKTGGSGMAGADSTGTADGGTADSTGTADGGTADSTGTADGGVLKSRAKRSATGQNEQNGDGSSGQEGRRFRRKRLDPSTFKASAAYDSSMLMLNQYMSISEDDRISIGIAREDFMKDCTYLGTSCNEDLLFRTTSSAEYGNCFTFNANVTESSDPLAGERVTGLTGQQYSLDLLLDLNHHTFPPVTDNKGARVQVHQPDQEPDVENSGMSVMPNAATSIAIEQLTIQRLPYPYDAQCISSWQEAEYGPEPNTIDSVKESYSPTRCQKMCLQSLFIKNCGCFHAKYPHPLTIRKHRTESFEMPENVKPCLLTAKGNNTECTNSIQQKFDNGTVTCNCPSGCFEKSFNTFQSMALWPRDTYLPAAAGRMNIDTRELTPESRKELASNILEIKVFFKTLNTATLSQSPSYSYSSLLSSLGGAMSLYLGISIIMIAEILEFFCLLGWNLYRRARGTYVSPETPNDVEPGKVGEVKKVAIRPNGVEITYIGDTRLPQPKFPYNAPT